MTNHISALVGERLRSIRESRRMTQDYVASNMSQVGFCWTQVTVSQVESGRRSLSVDEVCVLSVVISAELKELIPVIDAA